MVFNFFFMKLNVLVLNTVEKVCQQNSAEWSTVTLLERLGQTPPLYFSVFMFIAIMGEGNCWGTVPVIDCST